MLNIAVIVPPHLIEHAKPKCTPIEPDWETTIYIESFCSEAFLKPRKTNHSWLKYLSQMKAFCVLNKTGLWSQKLQNMEVVT